MKFSHQSELLNERRIAFFLFAATLLLFAPVVNFDFINYDDTLYVTENGFVQSGLTWEGIKWAFTTGYSYNWHPLTWISHMLDVELFGLGAGGHHFTNVMFHGGSTIFLFLSLNRMTGATIRSAFVAALFAFHPLRVESVAWVAERKDVLSTFFGMVSLWFYSKHATGGTKSKKDWLLSIVAFGLSLMCKPMLVTLPFVLLLLDYWPLSRIDLRTTKSDATTKRALGPLLKEKAPFFTLSILFSVIAYWAQKTGGAVQTLDELSVGFRIQNAFVSYLSYLGKLLWPVNLAIPYPLSHQIPAYFVIVSAVAIAGITVFALSRTQQRYILVGWLWFLGTLVPVIGLVQVGSQSMADRYSYSPSIGIFISLAWIAAPLLPRKVSAVTASAVLIAAVLSTRHQLSFWQDNFKLWNHSLAITKDNLTATHNLANAYRGAGKLEQAKQLYFEALRIDPKSSLTLYNLGLMATRENNLDEAVSFFTKALQADPGMTDAYNNLGVVMRKLNRIDESERYIREALKINPESFEAHNNLANLLEIRGHTDEAIIHCREAIRLNPQKADAHELMARLLMTKDPAKAVDELRTAATLKPNESLIRNLAWILATHPSSDIRNGREAVEWAEKAASSASVKDAGLLDVVAAAYAEAGRFDQAIVNAQEALRIAKAAQNTNMVIAIEERFRLYEMRKPFHLQ